MVEFTDLENCSKLTELFSKILGNYSFLKSKKGSNKSNPFHGQLTKLKTRKFKLSNVYLHWP